MRLVTILLAGVCLSVTMPRVQAQSVAFRVEGATRMATGMAGDPGLRPSEQLVSTFDGDDRLKVDQSRSSGYAFFNGTHPNIAVAPRGDLSTYAAIGAGGSMLFDLRQFNNPTSILASLSVHVGSLDIYNYIDILGLSSSGEIDYDHPLLTVGGADLIRSEGGRDGRVTFGFGDDGSIGAIVLRSTGIAFEFDSLAVSLQPRRAGLAASFAPEPISWALMVTGFGAIGAAMRSRGRNRVSA